MRTGTAQIRDPGSLAKSLLLVTPWLVALAAAPPASAMQTDAGARPRQLLTALHVHSSASSGGETLAELVGRAAASGIDVIVLSENLGYEFRYAPSALRLLGELRLPASTLEDHGIERHLDELEAARREPRGVLLLAGVEVPPYYYWSGSLLRGDLTLHDMQRNLLIVPPVARTGRIDTAGFLRHIPVVGNRHERRYGWGSLVLLLPGLIVVVVSCRRLLRADDEVAPRWPWLIAGLLGAALLWLNFPFRVAPLAPYDTGAGTAPAQRVIDYTTSREGLVFWSMPEAVDDRSHAVGPVSVHLSTRPYPQALAATSGYTGFGGVYADTTRIWEAGGAWDDELQAYQAGGRERPPWLVGESAYHFAGQAGKQLGDVLTVLLVDEPTVGGAFDALAGGRAYALRRDGEGADLRLREFAAAPAAEPDQISGTRPDGGDGALGSTVARLGDTLLLPRGSDSFELVFAVEEAAERPAVVQLELVRNGEVTRRLDGTTPLRGRWSEALRAGEPAAYYRLIVRSQRPGHLVSNPIFVRRDDDATPPPR